MHRGIELALDQGAVLGGTKSASSNAMSRSSTCPHSCAATSRRCTRRRAVHRCPSARCGIRRSRRRTCRGLRWSSRRPPQRPAGCQRSVRSNGPRHRAPHRLRNRGVCSRAQCRPRTQPLRCRPPMSGDPGGSRLTSRWLGLRSKPSAARSRSSSGTRWSVLGTEVGDTYPGVLKCGLPILLSLVIHALQNRRHITVSTGDRDELSIVLVERL